MPTKENYSVELNYRDEAKKVRSTQINRYKVNFLHRSVLIKCNQPSNHISGTNMVWTWMTFQAVNSNQQHWNLGNRSKIIQPTGRHVNHSRRLDATAKLRRQIWLVTKRNSPVSSKLRRSPFQTHKKNPEISKFQRNQTLTPPPLSWTFGARQLFKSFPMSFAGKKASRAKECQSKVKKRQP